ncbi:MAG: thiamine-phosphate kinase [Phycisphaerae bacterium]
MGDFETEFVDWLATQLSAADSVILGIGDDMASLATRRDSMLMSSDMLLEGVHFDLEYDAPALVGRKVVACCASDCAAMAVRPTAMTISVAWSRERPMAVLKRIFEGAFDEANRLGVPIVGGDTTSWDHPIALDAVVVAEPYPDVAPVRRDHAQPGDALLVTGPLGGSRAGHHLTFVPRISEAKTLAQGLGASLHAMMDISDGLSLDLWRLCQASGVGAVLEESRLGNAISDAALRLAESTGRSPLDHALSDGEDFELLLAVDAHAALPNAVALIRVGRVVEEGFHLEAADGSLKTIQPTGYIH